MERETRISRKRRRQDRQEIIPSISSSTAYKYLSLSLLASTWSLLLFHGSVLVEGFIPLDPALNTGSRGARTRGRPTRNHQQRKYDNLLIHQSASKGFDAYALPSSVSRQGMESEDSGVSLRRLRSSSGLSRFHQSILSRTSSARQCFVTGRFPLTVTFRDCPTRKWLQWESNNELLVNETSLTKSLASLDRFQWLDRQERDNLLDAYDMVSVEFLAEIHVERPGYLQIMPSCQAGSTAAEQRSRSKPYTFFQQSSEAAFGSTATSWTASRRFDVADCPVLPTDRLWVTGFSLAGRTGHLYSIEGDSGDIESVNERTRTNLLWPNEVSPVPARLLRGTVEQNEHQASSTCEGDGDYDDALLVADGFLVPGKDRGGLYIVKHPGNPDAEWTVRLTSTSSTVSEQEDGSAATSGDRWFYHRASWVDLTGDGRLSVLTARCRLSTRFGGKTYNVNDDVASGISKQGELVWLECPRPYKVDSATGTPLEADGTVFDPFSAIHMPWKEHVLATGPDVMFCLANLDQEGTGEESDTIEVLSSEFFNERVTVRSIQKGPQPKVVFERTIDDRCGAAFGCIPAFLDECQICPMEGYPTVVDSGSTVQNLKEGDKFSHLLVTSHECSYVDSEQALREIAPAKADGSAPSPPRDVQSEVATDRSLTDGGSLFAYRVPRGKPGAWKTEPWLRSTVATGFKVQGQLGNMINPGAPGFVYTFQAREDEENPTRRPLIAVAGDCAESAYLFRPNKHSECPDPSTSYRLMVEIKCGATVGSIAVGYDDFLSVEQESGYAKLYIPCFEKDKIMVFALGNGDDGYGSDDEDW